MNRDLTPDSSSQPLEASRTAVPEAALAEILYREEVLQARAMPPEEKLMAGERLFAWACEITLAGIHDQFPEATAEQCHEILAQRLALRRKLSA